VGNTTELPDHAQAVTDWLRGDRAADAGWVEAWRDHGHTVLTLHLPDDVHDDRQEVLAFRAGCAVRRFDPDTVAVDVEFAGLT
jgi:hypothetical protein